MKRQRMSHLWWFDLSNSLFRLKGLLFLVPFLVFWYPILRIINNHLSAWMYRQESLAFAYSVLDPAVVNKLLIEHPPSLSIYFLTALSVFPFFAILAGASQFGPDLANGYFKLTSTRCLRIEVFISRYLSALSLMIAAITLVSLVAGLISATKDNYSPAEVMSYLGQVCLMLYLYAAALLAFMTIISSFSRSAIAALFFGTFGYLLIVLIIWLGNEPETTREILPYLLPSALKQDLLLINNESSFIAIAILPLYAFIYGWIGWQIFKRVNF